MLFILNTLYNIALKWKVDSIAIKCIFVFFSYTRFMKLFSTIFIDVGSIKVNIEINFITGHKVKYVCIVLHSYNAIWAMFIR